MVKRPRLSIPRGVTAGGPTFSIFFVLCMEKLGHWLRKKVVEGRLREVKASRGGIGLSFLFFADDLIVFSEASEDQMNCVKEGLEEFCKCSGQRINFAKSSLYFSSNVQDEEADRLSRVMRIPRTRKVGKYLGHHITVDDKNRERHKELLQRVYNRIEGWKLRLLSRTGRITLAKSVVGSMPIFNMQIECLPSWVHKELDKATRKCVMG